MNCKQLAFAFPALLIGTAISMSARAEGTPDDKAAQAALDARMKQAYDSGQLRDRQNAGKTTDADAKARAKALAAADKAEAIGNMKQNLDSIKELWQKEEDAWKKSEDAMKNNHPENADYKDVGFFAQSVSMATVTGAEDLADQARNRLQDLEDMAKKKLDEAADAEIKQDFAGEAGILLFVIEQLAITKSADIAQKRFTSLRSKPEVAAYEMLKKAQDFEAVPNITEAVRVYEDLATNPRFEHSIPALQAKRKLDTLNADDQTRAKLKNELDAKAAKEAPQMFSTAKNYVANNMPKDAIAKLEQIMQKFPNTTYAEEAKKMIDTLK